MIHEGQEYARSKVTASTNAPDTNVGYIDHNSYNKDNETNYLDYTQRDLNRPLYNYYKGLTALRAQWTAFVNAPKNATKFLPTQDEFFIAYTLKNTPGAGKAKEFLVLLNGNPEKPGLFELPKGEWTLLANDAVVDPSGKLGKAQPMVRVPATSGMVLVRNSNGK